MLILDSSSEQYSRRFVQPAHRETFIRQTYKVNDYNRIDYTSMFPNLTVNRLVNELFAGPVECRNYSLLEKSIWYDGNVAIELNKMKKNGRADERPKILWKEPRVDNRFCRISKQLVMTVVFTKV